MSDDDFDDLDVADDLDTEPRDPELLVRHLRRQLKAQNRELAGAREVFRDLAMARAGVDLSTKLGQMFAKGYDGDVQDVARLVSEAAELGVLRPRVSEDPLPSVS